MELFVIAVLLLGLSVAATVSVVRSGPLGIIEVLWLAIIWLIAVIGPLLWFVVGRNSVRPANHDG